MSARLLSKKVRGLSLLQKRIMAVAAKGWITPAEATTCAYQDYIWNFEEPLEKLTARVAASASRALRRLVQRKLLTHEPARFLSQSPAYRLMGWIGPIPWLTSSHTHFAVRERMSLARTPINETLNQFNQALVDRYKGLDRSLTKAEREIGKQTVEERLNTFLTEGEQELLRQAETEIATAAGIPLPEDLSVEDGRKVLVGILERRRLMGSKELRVAHGFLTKHTISMGVMYVPYEGKDHGSPQ